MSKNLLFLTTANLATNPRLVKEVRTGLMQNFEVKVIMFTLGNWSDEKSLELIQELEPLGIFKVTWLNATSSNKILWLFWGILEKAAQKLNGISKKSLTLNAIGNSRRSLQLYYAGKNLEKKPDLICAHNLGALYPAYKLGTEGESPFIFDVEDYHPGETIQKLAGREKERREFLMKSLLPKAKAITFASPLIKDYTLDLINGHPNNCVILNSFPEQEFIQPKIKSGEVTAMKKLQLVWFSQKVSYGRGLEELLDALLQFATFPYLQITLIGDIDETFNQKVIKPFLKKVHCNDILQIIPPLLQSDLHKALSKFDIGLALEFDNKDLNRQLCLTNKIVAYRQAGLYILATDTKAQKKFMSANPDAGAISGQTVSELKESINTLLEMRKEIRDKSLSRFFRAKELSWDQESSKLNKIWNSSI